MAKDFKDQVMKSEGKTYGELLKTEGGRKKLAFMANLPVEENEYKNWILKRNKWIRENLEIYKTWSGDHDSDLTVGKEGNGEKVPAKTINEDEEFKKKIIFHLEEIRSDMETALNILQRKDALNTLND